MPDGMTFVDAAAIPEAFVTAWDAMVDQARLCAGETVLVHAVGSGVGTAGLQIARAVGASALGTARTSAKIERARDLGLAWATVVDGANFAEKVLSHTRGRGVDVVLELVGGAYVAEDLACLAPRGRIVVVGTMGGAQVQLDLSLLMRKRAELRGTVLRTRPLEEKMLSARALERHIAPLLASGAFRAIVDRVLPLAEAAEAHRVVQSNATFGKVVLEV
jgi:NADPH:quinone reductase